MKKYIDPGRKAYKKARYQRKLARHDRRFVNMLITTACRLIAKHIE